MFNLLKYFLIALITIVASSEAAYSANLQIWPIIQSLLPSQSSSSLWLENSSDNPITLQVRIYKWDTENGQDRYAKQNDIFISPPLLKLDRHQKQLIRLLRLLPPEQIKGERAYRLIIDEVPNKYSTRTTSGVVLRMRYTLPLFVYGKDVSPEYIITNENLTPKNYPHLLWNIIKTKKGQAIHIQNEGPVHTRLLTLAFKNKKGKLIEQVNNNGVSYILVNRSIDIPLPKKLKNVSNDMNLEAKLTVNGPLVNLYPAPEQ